MNTHVWTTVASPIGATRIADDGHGAINYLQSWVLSIVTVPRIGVSSLAQLRYYEEE
jgi:hypothetical protein